MRRFLSLAVSIGALLVALTVVGLYYVERPTVFRVAVAKGGESQKLLVALNQEFVRDHSDVRFRIMPAADSRAAAKAMEERSADLAVVRSDANMPPNASTALILEHQILVVMAPPGSSLTSIAELKDKRVGFGRAGLRKRRRGRAAGRARTAICAAAADAAAKIHRHPRTRRIARPKRGRRGARLRTFRLPPHGAGGSDPVARRGAVFPRHRRCGGNGQEEPRGRGHDAPARRFRRSAVASRRKHRDHRRHLAPCRGQRPRQQRRWRTGAPDARPSHRRSRQESGRQRHGNA